MASCMAVNARGWLSARRRMSLKEPPIEQVSFGVIGVNIESSFQTPLCRGPVPFAPKQDRAQRELRIRARVIQRQSAKSGGLGFAVCLRRRRYTKLGLCAL